MHSRVFLGVAAWLAGASAATGVSLIAVNMLGQGVTPAAGEQLSAATVNRALAEEAAGWTAAGHRRTVPPRRSAPPRSAPRRSAPPRSALPRPSPTAPPRPAARHPAPPSHPAAGAGTVFTSQGGTLVASCAGARAYLVSWSPLPGFASAAVVRGPTTNARVTFTSGQLTVTVIVSCYAGAPTAAATAVSAAGAATAVPAGAGDGD